MTALTNDMNGIAESMLYELKQYVQNEKVYLKYIDKLDELRKQENEKIKNLEKVLDIYSDRIVELDGIRYMTEDIIRTKDIEIAQLKKTIDEQKEYMTKLKQELADSEDAYDALMTQFEDECI